ncbi:MAG: flagellar FliJ family protein [Blastocatellia bacterium]
MKKPKYRLEPLVYLREKAKQEAERLTGERRNKLLIAEAELERRQHSVTQCRTEQNQKRDAMLHQASGGIEAGHLQNHRLHLADLKDMEAQLNEAVETQQQVVRRAEVELEKALAHLLEATKELRTVEKHREVWRERMRQESLRQEQKLNDEIGALLHQNKQ